jgi:hypothetical protein
MDRNHYQFRPVITSLLIINTIDLAAHAPQHEDPIIPNLRSLPFHILHYYLVRARLK